MNVRLAVDAPRWFTVAHPRLLCGEHPCPGGDLRVHQERLRALLQHGVTTFVDLSDPARENGIQPYVRLLRGTRRGTLPVSHHAFPLPDGAVPSSVQVVEDILDVIDVALFNGEHVFLHCRAGVGRTGTLAALHLVRHGHTPRRALQLVQRAWQRDARSVQYRFCPQTPEQRRWVIGYAPSSASLSAPGVAAPSKGQSKR